MPIAKQSANSVGLLEITATISLVAGAVWLATRNTNAAIRRLGRRTEESAVLAEVKALGPRIDGLVQTVRDTSYAEGYTDGLGNQPPAPPHLRAVN